MRQIEIDATNAFKAKGNMSKSNTQVTTEDKNTAMFLHGNKIAQLDKDGKLSISNAGWESTTTKSRLNAVLDAMDTNKYIFQKNFVWYIHDNETGEDTEWNGEWVQVK